MPKMPTVALTTRRYSSAPLPTTRVSRVRTSASQPIQRTASTVETTSCGVPPAASIAPKRTTWASATAATTTRTSLTTSRWQYVRSHRSLRTRPAVLRPGR